MRNIKRKFITPLIIIILLVTLISTTIYLKRKTIIVVIDGHQEKIVTYKNTTKEALDDKKISLGPKDKVEPTLQSHIADKGTITIKHAVPVTVSVDDKELNIQSAEDNIESMLKAENISLNDADKISPDKSTLLSDGLKIDVTRVETKTLTENVPVEFKTVIKNDSTLPNTKTKTLQDGTNGENQVVTSVVYENGKEVSRKVVSETVLKKPVDKIVAQGTLPTLTLSRGGDPVAYTKVIKAQATAYYAVHGVGNTYTASGRKAVRDPNGYSTIAVDPNVIPLGTKLYIEGYGLAIAADTGTGIKGNLIDVFFDTYGEACKWAVKNVNVYVIK